MKVDPVELTRALVRCPSVTPKDAGAQDLLAKALEAHGFSVERWPFGEGAKRVENLFATTGEGRPHLVFNGHTDVVPVGDETSWSADPFGGESRNGRLYGRGACDMKSGVAAFTAAACRWARNRPGEGRLSLLITGDEEGPAVNGSVKMFERLVNERGLAFDACLVGEPTSAKRLGDTVKIGRRGSITGRLKVAGKQGHAGYPHLADNAAHRLVRLLHALIAQPLDEGSERFEPSTLQITTADVGNLAHNVIPGTATAVFNSRFNTDWSAAAIEAEFRRRLGAADAGPYRLELDCSAEPFLTEPGSLSATLQDAVEAVAGVRPALSTTGGTSDARFAARHGPVVEFGLVGDTMHQVDESVAEGDARDLARIYLRFVELFFERGAG